MDAAKLKDILDKHLKWLKVEDGGERADLRSADLRSADLSSANLSSANLRSANLRSAKIEDKLLDKFYPIACPESGTFIAWKKAKNKIVKLEVCEDAKRSSAFTRKCRCSAAKVIAIENVDGTDSGLKKISSNFDPGFIYRVGEIVRVENFDDDRKNECAPGIHFFITRQEAVDW